MKLGKLFLACLIAFSLAWLVSVSWLDLWLWQKMQLQLRQTAPGNPLHTAVGLLALLPLTLGAWAIPLGIGYRLLYDRRVPAGLPTWRRGNQVGLVVDYKSPFWRGYTTLFTLSLVLLPIHLLGPVWGLVALELVILCAFSLRVSWRHWRANNQIGQQVVIDKDLRTLRLPPLGELAWNEIEGFAVEPEVVVSPRRDTTHYWVVLKSGGSARRWKNFALEEHAQQVVHWLKTQVKSG